MSFDEAQMGEFAAWIASLLEIQVRASGREELPSLSSSDGAGALGYVYGFVDAGVRSIGHDMSDISIGAPVILQVLESLFPGRVAACVTFLEDNLDTSEALLDGIITGRQQFLDCSNGMLYATLGLARYINRGAPAIEQETMRLRDAVLETCDLPAVRDELLVTLAILSAKSEADVGWRRRQKFLARYPDGLDAELLRLVSEWNRKEEFVAAYKAFAFTPSIANARALLDVAPQLDIYFEPCTPLEPSWPGIK